MRAVKGNKEYTIDETQQKSYQDSGFDIMDDSGQVVAYGRGKTVPYDDHMRALKEIGSLHERIAKLEAAANSNKESGEESEKKTVGKKDGE